MAKYIWQNKRARIKYKTLQLLEEKWGISLQCLCDYYYAAQLRPLICLCSPTYSSGWKAVEGTVINGVPIMALLADKNIVIENLKINILKKKNDSKNFGIKLIADLSSST